MPGRLDDLLFRIVFVAASILIVAALAFTTWRINATSRFIDMIEVHMRDHDAHMSRQDADARVRLDNQHEIMKNQEKILKVIVGRSDEP